MSKKIYCGDVAIGGGAPISIQSMTNVNSQDEGALMEQIARLSEAGCQIVRIAIPDFASAETLKRVKKKVRLQMCIRDSFTNHLCCASGGFFCGLKE